MHEPDRLGGKPRQPPTDGVPDTRRHRPLAERLRPDLQRPADLRDVEGIAPGACVHLLDVVVGQLLAEERGQLQADLRSRQAADLHCSRRRMTGQPGQQDVAEGLGVPVVHDEKKPLGRHGLHEMLQEEQGRVIGPVRVVEDDQEWPILRQPTEQPIDRIEEPEAVLGRAGAVRLVGLPGEQVGREPRQLGGQPLVSCRGSQVALGSQGTQDLPPRPIRRCAGSLRRPSPHDHRAHRTGHGGQFLHQPRLPDPGLSAAEHQAAVGRRVPPRSTPRGRRAPGCGPRTTCAWSLSSSPRPRPDTVTSLGRPRADRRSLDHSRAEPGGGIGYWCA